MKQYYRHPALGTVQFIDTGAERHSARAKATDIKIVDFRFDDKQVADLKLEIARDIYSAQEKA